MTTIYKLTWGAGGHIQQQVRFFNPNYFSDAAVRFSERVLEMDRNPDISAAYASLERMPDSIYPKGLSLLAWTKTSDERPTVEGELSAEAAMGAERARMQHHEFMGGDATCEDDVA